MVKIIKIPGPAWNFRLGTCEDIKGSRGMKKLGDTQRKILLLDGYNVMRRLDVGGSGSLQSQRERLALYVSEWQRRNAFKGEIYCVFDGKDKYRGEDYTILHGLRCVFSNTREEADGRLVRMVREADNPEQLIVVSDDNYVANNCRALGASTRSVSFMHPKKKSSAKSATHKKNDSKNIDQRTANAITHEMKKVWGVE